MLAKLRKWVELTAPIYTPIFFCIMAVLGLDYIFHFNLANKAKEIMGIFLAIALYTISIATNLRKIPVFPYSQIELVIFCIFYLFFHVWLIILLITCVLPNLLPACLIIPNGILYLMAGPAIYFVSKVKTLDDEK